MRQQHVGARATAALAATAMAVGIGAHGGTSAGATAAACADAEDATTITVGANVAVTGGAANIGSVWQQGLELGVDAANADGISVDGECYRFELELEDNQTNVERAIGANQRFVRDDVRFIFGPGVSSLFTPAYESLRGTDTLVVTPATTAIPLLGSEDGALLFDTHIVDAGEEGRLRAMGNAVIERYDPATVALLLPQDAPGEIHTEGFTETFEAAGVEVVYTEFFDPATDDFASFIAAISAEQPDMVVIGYLDRWVEPFLRQAVEAELTAPVLVGSPGSTFAAAADKPIANYAISITTRAVDDPDDAQTEFFRETFEAHFGEAPGPGSFWALSYFDAVQMLAEAIEEAGTVDDLPAIAEALHAPAVEEYPGRTLDLSFSDTNQALYTPQMGYLEDGETTYEDAPLG